MKIGRLRLTGTVLAMLVGASLNGCNRAAARIPGASLSFPKTSAHFVAQATFPYTVVVALPTDARANHYGERVAGTSWTGCSTDPFWGSDVPALIRERLTTELRESKMFARVSDSPPSPGDVVIRTEIDALCSQAVGFLFIRVAGISSLKIAVERDGLLVFENKYERVVTDADREYTGSQVTFIEQAMAVTLADSLRELFHDLLAGIQWQGSKLNSPPAS